MSIVTKEDLNPANRWPVIAIKESEPMAVEEPKVAPASTSATGGNFEQVMEMLGNLRSEFLELKTKISAPAPVQAEKKDESHRVQFTRAKDGKVMVAKTVGAIPKEALDALAELA